MNRRAFKWIVVVVACSVAVLSVAFWFHSARREPAPAEPAPPSVRHTISRELAAEIAQLEAKEHKMNETVWAKEILAQECGRTFENLWNALNASTNKLETAAAFAVGEVVLAQWKPPQHLPHNIDLREAAGPGAVLTPAQWRGLVSEAQAAGWRLAQTEFRHKRFETDAAGEPRQSLFYFSAHLTNFLRAERAILEGEFVVDWAEKMSGDETQPLKRIAATRLMMKTRPGETPFRLVLSEKMAPPRNSSYIDPLILYDLDGDGLSEIVLAAKNLIYRRNREGVYASAPLCRYPPGVIYSAVIADFDGDGIPDFLCQKFEALVLFKGSAIGEFDEPGRTVWQATPEVQFPMVLTCGDVDHDGDLDVFMAQYKVPYDSGQMPTPYYDANDGYPAYLLLNDGRGNFAEATEAAGLGKKRWRRSYSASLVDLNADGNLDLLVVSDFAGADVYQNDGHGHFADVTAAWLPDAKVFGMAHTFADFNADGRLDLLIIGMTSPTVDRLTHLGLWRNGGTGDRKWRSTMTVGNRLFLGKATGGFEQTALSDAVARSGWSWGSSAFDLDNDAFPDIYIANGMESRESVRDYEGEFWLHDSHVGSSADNPAVQFYLKGKVSRLRSQGASYGGYEKNRLYLNQGGASFVEIAHLMGVALEVDSRNVVSDDLNGDGRVDLVVTSFEPWPDPQQTLRVYENHLTDAGNWVGFRFQEEGRGASPVGVRVEIRFRGHRSVRHIVTGDSHRSQHANTVHFGLGEADEVESAEVFWPNGSALTLRKPSINRYHSLRMPEKKAGARQRRTP